MQYNYCKFLKLSNGEEIIVTTDNDCSDFKNDRYLSVMDAVQVKEMQVCRGPLVVETHVMESWIKLAKNDIIQIPTDNIIVAVDVEDKIVLQYQMFLEKCKGSDIELNETNKEEELDNFYDTVENEEELNEIVSKFKKERSIH